MLEINTTVPLMIKRNCCSFNASHKKTRHFIKVAYVTFRGNVEFKSGSRINVTGKYALSITSQNGNITIQTDINMICNREDFNSTCLGGFTSQATIIRAGGKSYNIYNGEAITFHFFHFFSLIFLQSSLHPPTLALNSLYANSYSQFKYLTI